YLRKPATLLGSHNRRCGRFWGTREITSAVLANYRRVLDFFRAEGADFHRDVAPVIVGILLDLGSPVGSVGSVSAGWNYGPVPSPPPRARKDRASREPQFRLPRSAPPRRTVSGRFLQV